MILGLAFGLLAATMPVPCGESASISLDPSVAAGIAVLETADFLADEEARSRLRDVMLPPRCTEFDKAPEAAEASLPPGPRYWLRFRIDAGEESPEAWLLLLRFSAFERLCVHWPVRSDLYRSECTGLDGPSTARPIPHHRFAFSLPRELDRSRPVFVEAEAGLNPHLRSFLVRTDLFLAAEHRTQFLGGIFYGLLFATVGYGLTLVVGMRDRVSLLYAGHLSCLSLALLGFEGRGHEWLWWWLGSWDVRVTFGLLGASFVLGAAFGRAFLRTAQRLPRVDRVLRVSGALAVLGMLLAMVSPAASQQVTAVATVLFVGGLGSGAFALARRGDLPARYLLLGIAAFLAGIFIVALNALGLPLLAPGTGMIVTRSGVVIGAFAMALALGQRVRQLRAERDRAKAEADAQQQIALLWASTDELTQLPNRSRFVRDGTRLLGEALAAGESLVVCVVDIVHFREVHHGFGQESDSALVQVARRLRRAFSRETLLARLGSDDFAIAARARGSAETAARGLAAASLATFREPFRVGERDVRLEATAGLAWAPDYGHSVAELLRTCDAAIYDARERGGGPVAVYASDESAADLALRAELWRALEEGQLLNVYQPQHDLRNAERVGGVETLLRWRHPERGLLSPGQFLPVAEKGELISHIGEWTLRQACRDLKEWLSADVAPDKLAINVSALDFQRAGFGASVGRLLREEGVPPQSIELELTESLLLADLPAARTTIRALRELEIRVALDDFGTGYSSLTQLRDLPITGLKVDQSFVAALDRSPEANAILSTLVALAGELDLELTAEGVESAWQRDVLRRHGCHLAQGYYFARPMPAAEMQRYLGGVRTGPVEQA